jgi:cytochrome b pre-mRNA-processing protein 3
MLRRFRKPDPNAQAARRIYECLVERSRAPDFYRAFGVADTIDGRFDLLALHAYLALDALGAEGAAGRAVGEALVTTIFTGFDEALRDLGVSDMGLSRRIKAMANAFYGRLDAYRAAAESETALAEAILRNIYRGEDGHAGEAAALAKYVRYARADLQTPKARLALLTGTLDYGPLPKP